MILTNLSPTIYSFMESIVNHGVEPSERTKIVDLAGAARTTIFNFNYPLSTHVDKADFEKQILNHFIMRRINYDTFTLFQIMLANRLQEIMPKYNIMFDALSGWELFQAGTTTRTYSEEATSNTEATASDTSDRRYSDTPQNQLADVKSGSYVSEYNYDQGNSSSTAEGSTTSTVTETITRTADGESSILIEFQNGYFNIMTQIYSDLEPLFYGLME